VSGHAVELAEAHYFWFIVILVGNNHGLWGEVSSLGERLSENIVWNLALDCIGEVEFKGEVWGSGLFGSW